MSEEDKFTTVTIPMDQVEMFTLDIENGDSSDGYWYYGHRYTAKDNIDDMCIPVDYNYTVS